MGRQGFLWLLAPNRPEAADLLREGTRHPLAISERTLAPSFTGTLTAFRNSSSPPARRLLPASDSLIMSPVLQSPIFLLGGRNGFDGITGRKMRAEDHGLAKNMETKVNC